MRIYSWYLYIPNKQAGQVLHSLQSVPLELKPISVQDVEKELEVQIGMKQEMELSMKMLEKDICEKQDALVELRQQLEDLRAINQQLSHKSQVSLCYTADITNKNMWLQHDTKCFKCILKLYI